MDHAEAIGNEGLAEGGDLLGVSGAFVGVLRGLLRVETNVLKQHNVAIVHGGDLGLSVLAVGVLGQRHVGAEQLAEAGGNRGQAQLRNDLAFRAAKVGHEDDLGAFFAQGLDGRQSSLDSTVIGDGGAVQRNIEISANQNALALEISKVLECLLTECGVLSHRCRVLPNRHGKSDCRVTCLRLREPSPSSRQVEAVGEFGRQSHPW